MPVFRTNFPNASRDALNALEQYVIDSEATVMYLGLSRDTIYPFIDPKMTIDDRIFYSTRAIFFFRQWREWMSQNYDISINFLTDNAYICMEINFNSLVQLILKLKEERTVPSYII